MRDATRQHIDETAREPLVGLVDLETQRRRLGGRIDKAISRVLEHGKFIMGPEVGELEERLATYCGVRHAISCASGTDALTLALLARGVGPGDAVFVPSFTFAATAEAVALLGATPVFVDVLPGTFNLDAASLAAALADLSPELRPVGVIPVDLFGHPADYPAITDVANRSRLWVIGDGAQSFGAAIDDKKVGGLAPITTTSFFPAKPLGCYGDGGAVFTDDDEVAGVLRSLRVHGQGSDKYDNVRIGINGRLDTIQAAVLLAKLEIFEDESVARQIVASIYAEELHAVVAAPIALDRFTSAWAQYTVVLPSGIERPKVVAELKKSGIPTAVYYSRPLHQQSAYRSYPTAPGGPRISSSLSQTVLSLPMHPYLKHREVRWIAGALRRAVAAA